MSGERRADLRPPFAASGLVHGAAGLSGAEDAEVMTDVQAGLSALADLLQHAPEALQLHVRRRGHRGRLHAWLTGAEDAEVVTDVQAGLHTLADLLQHAPEALQLHVRWRRRRGGL